jgi:hypothetical protein
LKIATEKPLVVGAMFLTAQSSGAQMRFWRDPAKRADRLRQRHGLIVKGKRISCPPHYAPPNSDYDPPHHDYEHGFPLIRSLRASTQRSTSVLFSFVLSLLIVVGQFASGNQKRFWRDPWAQAEAAP